MHPPNSRNDRRVEDRRDWRTRDKGLGVGREWGEKRATAKPQRGREMAERINFWPLSPFYGGGPRKCCSEHQPLPAQRRARSDSDSDSPDPSAALGLTLPRCTLTALYSGWLNMGYGA